MTRTNAAWRTQNVGSVLSRASLLFERDVLRVVKVGEFSWVTQVQLALFRNLDLGGTRLTDLAARARMTKQSMHELVDKAEAFGVVQRRAARDDRRAKIVEFTSAGLRMLGRFREGVAEAESRLATLIGDECLAEIKEQLANYSAAEDGRPDPDGQQGVGRASSPS